MEALGEPVVLLIILILGMVTVFRFILEELKRDSLHAVPLSVEELGEGDFVKVKLHLPHEEPETLWLEVKKLLPETKEFLCNIIDHPSVLKYKKKDDEVTIHLHQVEEYVRKDKQDVPYAYYCLLSYFY